MNKTDLLLDTHTWIWLVNGEPTLSNNARRHIEESAKDNNIFISAISCWEISLLASRERVTLNNPCLDWIKKSLFKTGIEILPITPEIAVESANLPDSFHGDPADRLIVATARVEDLLLITRDASILSYSQKKHLLTLKA